MTRFIYKIHDKLYDLTDFVKIHPGGQDMFQRLKPFTNITPMIYAYHKNPTSILTILPKYEIVENANIKYDCNYKYDSYCELKRLVYDEIKEKNIPIYWSNEEILYNAIMFVLYLAAWIHVFYKPSYTWIVLQALFTLGWFVLVFHETSHYGGFKNQSYNRIVSDCFPFANKHAWKYKHNYLHHSFTDTIYDYDTTSSGAYYFTPDDIYQFYHKYQYLYIIPLYISCSTFVWKTHISLVTSNIFTTILLFYLFGVSKTILFFSTLSSLFAFISYLSHIQEECICLNKDKKNDYLYNQVSSTINYRTDDCITRFICFGLDIQIEHHLFPNLPHSSLRKIQHIVRDYCDKNDIPYIEKPSIFPLIYSHYRYLYKIGNP